MIRIIFLLCCFLLSLLSQAQLTKRLDSLIKIHVAQGFNGNVLYSKNDSVVFTGNYGYADFTLKTPLKNHSTFELASLTKQFTALAILQLVERKKISLDQAVSEIIPSFPYAHITINHLLRHQSGLIDEKELFSNRRYWSRKKMAYNHDLIDLLAKHKPELHFVPGRQYEYSNTGYTI